MRPITRYEFPLDLTAYLAAAGNRITVDEVIRQVASKDVARILAEPNPSKDAYDAAVNVFRPRLQKIYADMFAQHMLAAIVFPTTPLPARPIRENGDTGQDTVELNGRQVPTFATYARNAGPSSLAGIPGLSVPIGMTRAGLPVGLEFDGPVNSDRVLLSLGMSVEQEFGMLPPPKL
jgi:mandelamide amidase